MVERKLYKTKLCLLYQRGRCSRQHCNFAHGNAELRRSFNGRQEHRGSRDLRERLDRMRSPLQDSPGKRDLKARHSSPVESPRSLGKRIDRNHTKGNHVDNSLDYSGKNSDGSNDQLRDRRRTSSDTRIRIDAQLREMHSEIKTLENHKRELEIYLEDRDKEADSLTSKIRELEMQLSKEKEEGKRFTTKIKKFIKAYNRRSRVQEELKRSHAQLQKLGEHLGLDVSGSVPGHEDDSKINSVSDDMADAYAISPLNEGQVSSPRRKRSRLFEAYDASNQVNVVGGRTESGKVRQEKASRQFGNRNQLYSGKKGEADVDAYNGHRFFSSEDKSNRGTSTPVDIASVDKYNYKVSETGSMLPPTGIAAHAMDEDVEVVEMDNKIQAVNAAGRTGVETEVSLKTQPLQFPPPPLPPIPPNAYAQHKGDDENVDIDGVDEDSVEVDIV